MNRITSACMYRGHASFGDTFILVTAVGLLGATFWQKGATATTTEVPSNGSFLFNSTTVSPQHRVTKFHHDHDACAHQSLVPPDYKRVMQPTVDLQKVKREQGFMCPNTTMELQIKYCSLPVEIFLDILQITDVDENTGLVSLIMILRQSWTDPRLLDAPEYRDECPHIKPVNNDSVGYVPNEVIKTMWFPDVYFNRIEHVQRPEILVPAEAFRVSKNKTVTDKMFGTFLLSCPMDFHNFPMDVQYCPLYIETWRLMHHLQKLVWNLDNPVGVSMDYSLDQFSFRLRVLNVTSLKYASGTYSRIGLVLIFSRELQFYILQIYFPTVLFVIISWLTFIIPPTYAQGRIILTITTMLTLAALFTLVGMHSPSSSYLKAIDVWMFVCLTFVFAAVVDCLVDIRLRFVESQMYKRHGLGFLTPVSVALVENREVFDEFFGEESGAPDGTQSLYADALEADGGANPPLSVAGKSILKTSTPAEASRMAVNFAPSVTVGSLGVALAAPEDVTVDGGSSAELAAPEDVAVDGGSSPELAAAPEYGSSSAALAAQRDRLQYLAAQTNWALLAARFEKWSFVIYPCAFLLFNVCYWAYYLNASSPPPGLAKEMAEGFVPKPRMARGGH